MTPNETIMVKGLVAVAWADGQLVAPEEGMLRALLWAFGATEAEETELLAYAQTPRTLKDSPALTDLDAEERKLMLAHGALLTHADGTQTRDEQRALVELARALGFSDAEAKPLIAGAREKAQKLAAHLSKS